MPTGSIQSFAKKYGVSEKIAEKEWASAKKIAEEQYGKPSKSPKSKKGKNKNSMIYGTAMTIFKNKMKSHYGKEKNENRLFRFDNFLNENFDTQSGFLDDRVPIEEDIHQRKQEENEWFSNLKKLEEMFDNEHKNGPELETNIIKYVEGWLNYKQESQDFASELVDYVRKNYG